MKKIFKSVIFMAAVICCVFLNRGIEVQAQTVQEEEDNGTFETAQLIQMNRQTLSGAVAGNQPDSYIIEGEVNSQDSDFYRVYLNAGTNYVTLNGDIVQFTVYDSDRNMIESEAYNKTGFGSRAYDFNVATAGFYFIEISTSLSSTQDYALLVGEPVCAVESCRIELQLDAVDGQSIPRTADLEEFSVIPEGAIVNRISISGISSTAVEGITVRNRTTGDSISLARYTWSRYSLVDMGMQLASDWEFVFVCTKDKVMNPVVNIQYAYPVISEYVQEELEFIFQ